MQLVYYKDPKGNFGDDMNLWLWPEFFKNCWDPDDGVLFYGIGTILNKKIPRKLRKIIFGSGAGYKSQPPSVDSRWDIRFVRGPYTARYLGIEADRAITDPALLVRKILQKPVANNNPVSTSRAAFVPHHSNARQADWARVCSLAGCDYIDPASDVKLVVEKIAGAKMILAESMHAAIIADAYRIPWIPVVAHQNILALKWQDWCATLELDYQPELVVPGLADKHAFSTIAQRRRALRRKLRALLSLQFRHSKLFVVRPSRPHDYELAAEQLARCIDRDPQLSSDSVQSSLENRLMEQVARLQRDLAAR